MSLNIEELHQMLQRASNLEIELESLCDLTQSPYVSLYIMAKVETLAYVSGQIIAYGLIQSTQYTPQGSGLPRYMNTPQGSGFRMLSLSRDLDTLGTDVQSSVQYSIKRLSQNFLDDVFNKNKSGADDCMPAVNLRPALRELFPEQAVQEMEPYLEGFEKGGKVHKSQWEFLATRPAPLEEWAFTLPLGTVLANALSPLLLDSRSASAQKQRLTQCSKEDLTTVCSGLVEGMVTLLLQAIDEIKVQSSMTTQNPDSADNACDLQDGPEDAMFDAFKDDEAVIKVFFDKMRDSKAEISREDIEKALSFYKDDEEMVVLLTKMLLKAPLTLDVLKVLVKETPRLSGQRIVWAASLNLEAQFAKYLRCGNIFDGLKGIKEMTITELRTSCLGFSSLLPKIVEQEWQRITQIELGDNRGKTGFQALMNKFIDEGGFLGTFGDVKMFHAGLESQLGYPNPKLFKAILREHCFSADGDEFIITGNYGLAFTPSQEFARLFGNARHAVGEPLKLPTIEFLMDSARQTKESRLFEGPTVKELNEVCDELKRLQKVFKSVMKRKNAVFSGEHGDEHEESIFDIVVDSNNGNDASAICQTFSGLIATINQRYAQFLGGNSDKNGKRPDIDIRDAEAIARGIKVVDPAKVDGVKVSARISMAISQRERDEFKMKQIFEEILKEKNVSGVAGVQVQMIQNITYYFVDDLNGYGPNLSERMISDRLNALSVEELVAKLPKLKKGKNIPEKQDLIQQIITMRKEMIHCKQARRRLSLKQILDVPEVKNAKLRVEEALVVYQYTGPLFQKWNGLLRQIPNISGNKYTTTIHVLVSAVLKLSQNTKIPQGRRVYRGLGGMVLDDKWFIQDKRNTRGGVELGFLSTTLNRSTALEYSGVKRGRGIVLEIDVGAIDCGAQLDCLSQYPGEGELLFSPLSFLEVVGMPRFQIFEGKQVVVVQVKININLKAQKIEDMIAKRQQMHLASFGLLEDSVKYEIQKIADEENAFKNRLKEDKFRKGFTVDKFVEGIVSQVQTKRKHHEEIQTTEYLDNDIFRGLVIDMLDTAAMAQSKMRLYLTDKSLYIRDVAKLPLSAAQRMLIAYFTKNLPVDGQGSNLKAAEALCRLKGLKNDLTGDQRALIAAVANGLSFEDLKLLRDTGIDLNKPDEDGSTAVYVAAQCGNARCIQSLVALNADVNAKDTEDRTALFAAANIGNISCIQLLVSLRADVSVLDKQKTSPLMVAASAGYFDCVLELGLIDGGNAVNLEELKAEMLSALLVAIEKGQIKVVDFIVKFIAKDKMVAEEDFSDFCKPLFKRIDSKGLSLGILRYLGIDAKDNYQFDNVVDMLNDNLVSTILEVRDLVGKMLFRFCDVDKNNAVTDQEVIDCLKIVISVAAASGFHDEMSSLAKAIFRMFDLNGDGSLELAEVVSIAEDLLVEMHRSAKGILSHFQQVFKTHKEQMNDVVIEWIGDLSNYLQIELPFGVEELVTKLYAFLTRDDLSSFIMQWFISRIGLEELPNELSKILEPSFAAMKEIGKLALMQYKSFFSQIMERAGSHAIQIADCVQLSLACIKPIFDEFENQANILSPCLFKSSMYFIRSLLEDMPDDNPLKFIVVDETLLKEILDAIETSFCMHIKDVGFKMYFEAMCEVFASGPEEISSEQVKAIHQVTEFILDDFSSDHDSKQFDHEELKNALSILVSSIDKNNNFTLESHEIVDFLHRIILFSLTCTDRTVDLMRKVLDAMARPVLAFLFDVKSQVIGGNSDMLVHSDISAVALAVGMATGEIRVLQFALDMIGDVNGNVDQNSLEAVCFPLLKLLLGSPPVRNSTSGVFRALRGPFKNPEFLVKFHNSLVSKVKVICPIVGQTIFRILDLDRSGLVSKTEVTEMLEIINELHSDVSPSKRLVNIAHAVFRILDLDSDGKIAAAELSKALKEILDALVEMLIGMLEEVQEVLVDEPLKQIVEQLMQFMQRMQQFTDDECDSPVTDDECYRQDVCSGIPVETVLELVRSVIQGSDIFGVLAQMSENILSGLFDDEDENIKQIATTANKNMQLFYIQYKEFFSKVDELESNGQCNKEDIVRIGAVCLNSVVDSVQQSAVHVQAETMNVLMDNVQAKLASASEDYPANLINIDRQLVLNTLSEAFSTLYEHMKESGSKYYLEALFNLFDLQNSGRLKSSDLQALACILDAAFMTPDAEDEIRAGEEVENAIEMLIRMVDVDCDGILSKGEIIGCAKALVRLVCDLIKNTIVLLDHSVIAAIVPVIIIALNLKSQMLGGSDTALSHADVCSVVFAVSMTEGEDEIIKYLKGLLVYKEGDVDEQVFENLCCNLVRMFLFWVPEARQYTRLILSEFAAFVEWDPSEEAFANFHRHLMRETASICKFMGQALYRVFDIDQSGNVTSQEVKETLDLLQALRAGTEYEPVKIVKSIFRIFYPERSGDDKDGEGEIKLPEIQKVVKEVVELLSRLALQMLKHLDEAITKKPLTKAIKLLLEPIQNLDTPGIFPAAKIAEIFSTKISSQALCNSLKLVFDVWEDLWSNSAFENIMAGWSGQVQEFFHRVSEAAVEGIVDIHEIINIGNGCFQNALLCISNNKTKLEALLMECLDNADQELSYQHRGQEMFTEKKVEGGSVKVKMEIMTGRHASRKVFKRLDVPLRYFQKIIHTTANAFYDELMDKSMGKLVTALSSLFDPTKRNHILSANFATLHDLLAAVYHAREDEAMLSEKFKELQSHFLSFSAKSVLSSDSDPVLDFADTLSCASSVLKLVGVMAEEIITISNSVFLKAATPILELIMAIKGRVLESDENELTYEDIEMFQTLFLLP